MPHTLGRGCLKRLGRPHILGRGCLTTWSTPYPRKGLSEEARIFGLYTILHNFGPMVAQMLQMVSFGTILDHILTI